MLGTGKKVIRRRQIEKHFEGLLDRIGNVRPISTGRDEEVPAINPGKKHMLLQDKYTEIQRENRFLLERIAHSIRKRPTAPATTERMNRSLHEGFRKKQYEGIEAENHRLLRSIREKKSDYSARKLKEDWQKQKEVIKNIGNFPFILSDGSKHKRHTSRTLEPKQPPIEMVRIRHVDGVNLIITLKLGRKSLVITAEYRRGQPPKLIKIPKREALLFIDEECNGRMEGLFDRVHFDSQLNILYLLGKEAEIEENALHAMAEQQEAPSRRVPAAPHQELRIENL